MKIHFYLTEFIGTFFLVFVIGLTVIEPGAGALAPVAIGAALMVMVYAGGPISGAHYNPAVTIAVWMRGKCEKQHVIMYFIAQILAGVVAGILIKYLKDDSAISVANPAVIPALIIEVLFTFALAFVVLNVATSDKSAGNSYFGLAIGFTIASAAFAGGAISGGVYNPAVAVGISVMGLSAWGNIWIFLVANVIGGVLAAIVYKIVNPDEKK